MINNQRSFIKPNQHNMQLVESSTLYQLTDITNGKHSTCFITTENYISISYDNSTT